jgi:antirestriction protein ArdC
MPTTHKNKTQDKQAEIVAEIIRQIEAGAEDWIMPWQVLADTMVPTNALTGKRYKGSNNLWLAMVAVASGYTTGYWATYKQWVELGAQVRKGETGTFGVKWSAVVDRRTRGTEDEKMVLIPSGFTVFNAAQVDGWKAPEIEANSVNTDSTCERFFANIGAEVVYGGGRAAYMTGADRIVCPEIGAFTETGAFYSTLAHEHIHWTGQSSRLDRVFGKRFGDHAYAMEELVAELGAAFLCAHLGISQAPRPDHASYLAHWLQVLKADPSALFTAASKAQAAVDFLLEAGGQAEGPEISEEETPVLTCV